MTIYQVWQIDEDRPSATFTDKADADAYAAAVDSINVTNCSVEAVDLDIPTQCKPILGFVVFMDTERGHWPARRVVLGEPGGLPRAERGVPGHIQAYGYGVTEAEALANAKELLVAKRKEIDDGKAEL